MLQTVSQYSASDIEDSYIYDFAVLPISLKDKYTDTYFVGFNSNIFLRESCYRCKYCGQERISDFTAADFWGSN